MGAAGLPRGELCIGAQSCLDSGAVTAFLAWPPSAELYYSHCWPQHSLLALPALAHVPPQGCRVL